MKRYLVVILILLSYLVLASCSSNRNPYLQSDFVEERWTGEVNTTPISWNQGADRWFLTGDPSALEEQNRAAAYSSAVSTMMVRVMNFTNIEVSGHFQVQIFGSDHDSVYVYGPNAGVREVQVAVHGNTLRVAQNPNASTGAVKRVIVRIGVRQLYNLTQSSGSGSIEGVHLRSNSLNITAGQMASGNMYIGGYLDVRCITNAGSGTISVFGAQSHGLEIKTYNRGSVNISGNIDLKRIMHRGNNNINVIGACSTTGLQILADGAGKIGIQGRVNIREIRARGATCVYAYSVNSNHLYVYANDKARVGVAGYVGELYVDTSDNSRFWGRYLCAQNVYARARDNSHMNISAANRVFASATERSSIYFFGSPDMLSQYMSGGGVILPVLGPGARSCFIAPAAPTAKRVVRDYKEERAPVRVYKWKNKRLVEKDYIR